uniref:omega-hydroxyceramide transacylase n=1 Tax=Gasterosteus aculeatus aculeatus TaxID=481459 RepID=UPI001A999CBD|nr:omega-hydroxyceramide transacylase [Gasterosteus aculeatus aculeatus]
MAPGVSSCHRREVPPSISFSGSGFMATYQLGVAQSLLTYAPWMLSTAPCVLGASAGSLVAAAVVCGMSMINIRDEMLYFAKQMKAFALGPFNPSINVFHWLEHILHKHLPSDAHKLANGRLYVSMTRLSDYKHIVMCEFQSKEDVVQALLCSCFVPGYCGMVPPSFKGEYYVDGGFSSMQPVAHAQAAPYGGTLTVSPFSGEMDICPSDTPCTWDMVVSGCTLKGNMANCIRIANALYPFALETLEQAYHNGYEDATHFLQNNVVSYLMIHKAPQGFLNCNRTWTSLETGMKAEEERKEEKEAAALTTFITDSCMQKGSPDEGELYKSPTIKEPPLDFDVVKNVLLGNVGTYLSMFGLPARILSHLLLPLMLSFYLLLRGRHRLEMLFRQVPEFAFWAWHGLRHFTLFLFNISVCTIKKNIEDRVMPPILLWQWLIKVQFEKLNSSSI